MAGLLEDEETLEPEFDEQNDLTGTIEDKASITGVIVPLESS